MNAILLDAGAPASCQPLTCSRSLGAIPVANLPLAEQQRRRLVEAGLHPVAADAATGSAPVLFLAGDAWVDLDTLRAFAARPAPAVLRSADGKILAWLGGAARPPAGAAEVAAAPKLNFVIRFPWDFLRVNELLVGAIGEHRISGSVSPGVAIEGFLELGEGSRLLPGVYIEGNVVIGRDCKIGPNCYLRGNTAIGDGCHIGQAVEVKNSILLPRAAIGHLSYCGDSIVGAGANFGAGTITANYRHDGKTHRSLVDGALVDTDRRKFGAIIGDGVHTGIHTSIYPGRKLWPQTSTLPGAVVQTDLQLPR